MLGSKIVGVDLRRGLRNRSTLASTKWWMAVLLAASVGAPLGFGQNIYGSFTGVVTDSSGSLVPSAIVTARNTATAAVFKSRSDGEGVFWIRNLPVGVYDITGELTGFQKFEARDVRVQVDEVVRVDIRLSIGSNSETVTVTDVASVVDTTTATLKAVVDQKRIEELPLNGRNATQLMRMIVGVTTIPTQA